MGAWVAALNHECGSRCEGAQRAERSPHAAVSLNLWDAPVSPSGIGSIEGGHATWRSPRGFYRERFADGESFEADQEVVVGSRGPATVADGSHTRPHHDSRGARSAKLSGGPALLSWVPKLGVWAWSFGGFVAATIIVVLALAAVSEIVLPMTFAAVLAVIFKPLLGSLRRHWAKTTLGTSVVGLGLLAPTTSLVIARTAVTRRLLQSGSRPRRTDLANACAIEVGQLIMHSEMHRRTT